MGTITYARLWSYLKANNISQYTLIKKYHVSPGQIDRLKHDKFISTHTIIMLCDILNCRPSDILEYIPGDSNDNADGGDNA